MSRLVPAALTACALLGAPAAAAAAQTDWYNTDRGRPLLVEDAVAVERHAVELQVAPLRLSRHRDRYEWGVEPEVAWGVLPRTQLEVGAPIVAEDRAGRSRTALAGVSVSALHALVTETLALPAIALAADVLLPVGGAGPDRTITTVGLLATRTTVHGRIHVNGRVALGGSRAADAAVGEAARWFTGVALDRPLPLRSVLLAVEGYAFEPLAGGARTAAGVGTGVRVAVSPRLTLDTGVGRRFSGDDTAWSFTTGLALAFAVPAWQGGPR
jgi:hypothetical protein